MKKKFVLGLTTYLFFSGLALLTPPAAADVGSIVLQDWDDEIVGATNGSTTYIEWNNTAVGVGAVYSNYILSAPYCYRAYQTTNAVWRQQCYINLSAPLNTNSTRIFFRDSSDGTTYGSWFRFVFRNSTDVIQFQITGVISDDGSGTGDVDLTMNNVDGDHTIGGNNNLESDSCCLQIVHEHENVVNYTLWEYSGGGLSFVASYEGGWAHGNPLDYWDSLEIWIRSSSSGAQGATYQNLWIDDIMVDETDYTTSCPQLTGAQIYVEGAQIVPDVQQGDTIYYTLNLQGDIGTTAYVQIFDNNGAMKYIDWHIMESESDSFQFHIYYSYGWTTGNYSMTINDWLFIPCDDDFSTRWNSTFNVYNPVILDYDSLYDNTDHLYAEFDTIQYPDPEVADDVSIVYHLPQNTSCSDDFSCGWYYTIVLMHQEQGYINHFYFCGNNETYMDGYILGTYPYQGTYYLQVYNMTGDGYANNYMNETTAQTGTLEYVSNSIVVGTPSSSGDDDDDGSTSEEQEGYNVILGVLMCVGVGIGLLIVTHEPVAFIGASSALAFVLSQESLGIYNLLPSEVGYGLIVILVLVAVIAWLVN